MGQKDAKNLDLPLKSHGFSWNCLKKEVEKVFTSSYNHTIDAKNRLFIPAKFRDEFGEEIVISRSVRGKCLKIYSTAEWKKYLQPISEKMDRDEAEYILRVMNGNSIRLPLDSTGRVQLTKELIDFAELKDGKVVIVGCGDYAEIWSEEGYEKNVTNADEERIRMLLKSVGL